MQVGLYTTSTVFLMPMIFAWGPFSVIITSDFDSYIETLL